MSQNPVLNALHEYWSAKRGGGGIPRRSDIDPSEIRPLLPHIGIVERVGSAFGETRFRFRLAGTALAAGYRCDPTGRYADELLRGAASGLALEGFAEALGEGVGLYAAGRLGDGKGVPSTELLLLPLIARDGTLSQVILAQTFDWRERRSLACRLDRPPACLMEAAD